MNKRNLAILLVVSIALSACKNNDDKYAVNGSDFVTPDVANEGNCPFDSNAPSTASFVNQFGHEDWQSACIYEPTAANKAFIVYRKNVAAVASKEATYTVEKEDFDGKMVTETKTTKLPYSVGSTATFTTEQVFYENQDCSGAPIGSITSNGSVKVDALGSTKSPDPLYTPNVPSLKVTYTIEPVTNSVPGVVLIGAAATRTTIKDLMYASCTPYYNMNTGKDNTNVYTRSWWRGDPSAGVDVNGYPTTFSKKSTVYIISK